MPMSKIVVLMLTLLLSACGMEERDTCLPGQILLCSCPNGDEGEAYCHSVHPAPWTWTDCSCWAAREARERAADAGRD